jgi:ATPase components of ABC transporters with duplicated ATPase domains
MLLSLNEVTFEFGARKILSNASWHIFPNERIGLIGPNGTGKSTLLKILIGEYSVSQGSVNKAKNLQIGYFHQDLQSIDTDESIIQVAMGAFEPAKIIEKEIKHLEGHLNENSHEDELNRLAHLYHDFEIAGGYEMEHRAAEILEGLGFKTSDLERSFKEFSGGWRMRVLLGKMILQQPDILLLDEPTNHLDLPSIQWIERYLLSYQGTIIIVSHDRYFLDKMVTKIVEISQLTLNHYSGNYTSYESQKEERMLVQQREYENQQDFIRQQERFIERFRAKASKATQAQSLVKKLDRLDRIEAPINDTASINFRFVQDTAPGKVVSTLQHVAKTYADIQVIREATAEIYRGDKIALIGANGKGKSTLLRLIAGHESYEGTITQGHNVSLSFYAQHQIDALNIQQDMLSELNGCGSGKTEQELRQLLGCFLFSGDDVYKKISVLSGGEKARVALAKTIISRANFLLLDEPTNHLDITSVNRLIKALNDFEGTFVIVSHDRYFIQQTATKIWEIDNGVLQVFDGNYQEWESYKEKKAKEINSSTSASPNIEPVKVVEKSVKQLPIDKQRQKQEKRIRNQFQQTENNYRKKTTSCDIRITII